LSAAESGRKRKQFGVQVKPSPRLCTALYEVRAREKQFRKYLKAVEDMTTANVYH